MAGQLQEGAGQRLAGGRPQGGIAAAQLLLLGDGRQEALGHVPLRAGADARVLFGLAEQALLLEFGQAAVEAVENVLGFLGDVGQLPIGQAGQIGHVDLAVIAQGEKGGALAATSFTALPRPWSALAQARTRLDRALGRHGTGGGAAAGDAGRSLEHQRLGGGISGVWCGMPLPCAGGWRHGRSGRRLRAGGLGTPYGAAAGAFSRQYGNPSSGSPLACPSITSPSSQAWCPAAEQTARAASTASAGSTRQ